jgi:hypothetical protein
MIGEAILLAATSALLLVSVTVGGSLALVRSILRRQDEEDARLDAEEEARHRPQPKPQPLIVEPWVDVARTPCPRCGSRQARIWTVRDCDGKFGAREPTVPHYHAHCYHCDGTWAMAVLGPGGIGPAPMRRPSTSST